MIRLGWTRTAKRDLARALRIIDSPTAYRIMRPGFEAANFTPDPLRPGIAIMSRGPIEPAGADLVMIRGDRGSTSNIGRHTVNIGQIVTIRDASGNTLPAIVVGKSTAKVPGKDGGSATSQPCASVRVFAKDSGALPYIANVPVYDTIEEASADDAGRWSAYSIFASPENESADLSIPDVAPPAVEVAPPVVEPPVTFDEE